jgi:predicted secreted protein
MIFLIAFLFIILDKKVGYMNIISTNNIGIFLYSTNKKVIITTIISGVILILLYGMTIPLGINNFVIRTLYYVITGFIIAVGYSQDRINRKIG